MMQWLMSLSTRTKLLLSFGLFIVVLASVATIAVTSMQAIQREQKILQEVSLANAFDLLRLEANLNENRVALMLMVSVDEPAVRNALQQDIATVSRRNDTIMQQLRARNTGDPTLSTTLETLEQVRADFNRVRDTQTIPMITAGEIEAARSFIASIQTEKYLRVRELVGTLSGAAAKDAQTALERSMRHTQRTQALFLVIGIVTIALGIGLAAFLNRLIVDPLKKLTDSAVQIAAGNLNVSVPLNGRRDETGILSEAFVRMVHSLQGVARAAEQIANGDLTVSLKPQSAQDVLSLSFGVMTENLRGLVQEIKEGTTILHALSKDMVKTNSQLVSDLAEMEGTVVEADAAIQKIKQAMRPLSQPEEWVDRAESAFARMHSASSSSAVRAHQTQVTAQHLQELETRLRFIIGKLKV
jgi:nitrogen fixation/metabolism regulation signal transduction histidine kinase